MLPETFRQHLLTAADAEAGQFLRGLVGAGVDVLVVLGSGLADTVTDRWGTPVATCRLSEVPGVLAPVADGHVDELCVYRREGRHIAVAMGRTHLYEGHGPHPVTALARAVTAAGASAAILCNANGCLRDWSLGDVMAISDHVNFTAASPFDGTYFLDTSACWDAELTRVLAEVTQRVGTYAALRGPEYQTRAETRLLAAAEIDCVGMSTVLEALALHALGVRVAGMSVVSDLSFAAAPTDPSAVVEAAAGAQATLLAGLDAALAAVDVAPAA